VIDLFRKTAYLTGSLGSGFGLNKLIASPKSDRSPGRAAINRKLRPSEGIAGSQTALYLGMGPSARGRVRGSKKPPIANKGRTPSSASSDCAHFSVNVFGD